MKRGRKKSKTRNLIRTSGEDGPKPAEEHAEGNVENVETHHEQCEENKLEVKAAK